jgi:hypothetical protein
MEVRMFGIFKKKQPPTPAPAMPPLVQEAATQEATWREKPGAHERHLQRRCENLLFPAARRVVTKADLLEARRKDGAEYTELVDKIGALELPEDLPRNWNAYLNDIREQIDALKERAGQIGHDTTTIMDHLNRTRRDMGEIYRECMKNNPEGLRLHAEAEEAYWAHQNEFRSYDFGNQLLRDDPCIPSNELVPALLCEPPEACASFWANLPEENKPGVDKWIADCIHDAMQDGFDIGTVREQLQAMGWPRPTTSAA